MSEQISPTQQNIRRAFDFMESTLSQFLRFEENKFDTHVSVKMLFKEQAVYQCDSGLRDRTHEEALAETWSMLLAMALETSIQYFMEWKAKQESAEPKIETNAE